MNAFTRKPDVSAFIKAVNKDVRSAVGGLNSANKAKGQCLMGHSLPQKTHDLYEAKHAQARRSDR